MVFVGGDVDELEVKEKNGRLATYQ